MQFDPFETLPSFDPFAQQRQAPRLTPEQEQSLLGWAGSGLLSGASTLGAILDTPGSIVRNTLAGENPFKGLLSPDQRTSGRDLLRQYGLADQEDTWGNLAGGIAADILLDPITWLTLGGSAVLKPAGKVAKAAGIFENPMVSVAKTAPYRPAVAGVIGPRQARMTMRLKDTLEAARSPLEQWIPLSSTKAYKLAEDAAKVAGDSVPNLINETLGTLGAARIPFGPSLFQFGEATSPTAMKVAGALDAAGKFARNTAPIRALNNLFNAEMRGAKSAEGQQWGPEIMRGMLEGDAEGRRAAQKFADFFFNDPSMKVFDDAELRAGRQAIRDTELAAQASGMTRDQFKPIKERMLADLSGHYGPERAQQMRGFIEEQRAQGLTGQALDALQQRFATPHDPLSFRSMLEDANLMPTELRKFFDQGDVALQELRKELGLVGAADDILDDLGRYWPRQSRTLPGQAVKSAGRQKAFVTPDANSIAREEAFKGFAKGTEGLEDVLRDPDIAAMKAAGSKDYTALTDLIERKYVSTGWMRPSYEAGGVTHNQANVLAHKILDELPGEFIGSGGMFTNDPVVDFMARYARGKSRIATHATVLDMLSYGGNGRNITMAPTGEAVKLSKVLQENSFRLEPALDALANRTGISPQYLKNAYVPKAIADDITAYIDRFQGESLKDVAGNILNYTQWWKAWVTTRPAFNVRNLFSGQTNNALHGMWSPRSVVASEEMLRGKTPKALENLPYIERKLAEEGLAKTPENAKRMFLRELFAEGTIDRQMGDALSLLGKGTDEGISTIKELVDAIPGSTPFSAMETVEKAAGGLGKYVGLKDRGTRWTDIFGAPGVSWGNKGVPRQVATHPLIAANADVSYAVEFMNRVAPMIHLMEKGLSPAMAAARVRAAQAVYSSKFYAPLENFLYRYIFPFGKFSRSMMQSTFGQILDDPGGPIASLAKGMNESRGKEEFVPDYLTRSLMIPTGGTPEAPQYLSGLGLMVEDPFQFAGGPKTAIQELISRTTPLLKAPVEWATGRSFFQSGDSGGRALSDMDPLVGRMIANITGQKDAPRDWFFGNPKATQVMEQVAANSPASAALNIIRTAQDERKAPLAKALNIFTGFKLTDVPEQTRDALIRETITQKEKESYGGRDFTRTYIPQETLAKMTPEQRAIANLLEAEQNTLADRAKKRKKEAQKNQGMNLFN